MNSNEHGRRAWAARSAAAALAAIATLAASLPVAAYSPAGTLVSVDVYDRRDGRSLPVYTKDGRRYVVGAPGHEYAVRIRNCTGERILAVTSVDGVNVVTGDTASPDQSGYVIDPYGSVEIAGWRKSMERTAAFYFTDLGDSYAARTGRPNNVGVVGVAVFREKAPPVVWPPHPDRIASNEAAGERRDAAGAESSRPSAAAPPASGFAGTPDSAPMARQEAAADSVGAVAKAARELASPLGTGHGRSEASYAQRVNFERASTRAAETVTIQYDRRESLVAMGVIPGPRYAQRQPDPFPAMRFAPDPY
jgi:hypothetical protein